ncbi:MAG: glycogen/starch/alpha-glucan phosphorylase [Sphaerochaetaceae bacterium]|nr:glycogen/starch/alpha-glucan phosphorylase [Sphaerochaetaceae bacterium]
MPVKKTSETARSAKNTSAVRSARTSRAIAQDFAEHLKYDADADIFHTTQEGRYEALANTIRDRIVHQWNKSRKTQRDKNAKHVYYLSLEFLMGRAMTNNINNMGIMNQVTEALKSLGYTYEELADVEPDAGLGNGGLGRLAACFLDSMATLDIPSYGYGIRYNYGIFKQLISNGYQFEQPDNWLRYGNPWEIPRSDVSFTVNFGGRVQHFKENGKDMYKWVDTDKIIGMAYDMPIIGYGGKTVNTLRLWSAKAVEDFSFQDFNDGDYTQAVRDKVTAENISQVLYPNDTQYLGKVLRLKQQYFFVACSLADIVRRFKRKFSDWKEFPNQAAIQLNDTHPSIAVAELMRILIDQEGIDWDTAWEITKATLGYTNHTLMPEALEKWPVHMFEELLPRHLQIIYEINTRFLKFAVSFFPTDHPSNIDIIRKISIIEESNPKNIRMANLAIVGSHAINGVAALHTELLKNYMFPEFRTIYPDRFQNKTNGITPRRWLLSANPGLSKLITDAIGPEWITDASKLALLKPLATDPAFAEKFAKVKKGNKDNAASFLRKDCGIILNPDSIFDVQVKRIHEYKRQLLNAFNIVLLYQKLKNDSAFAADFQPVTFLFGGKSAPGYANAKLSIKMINSIADVINNDPTVSSKLRVHFMPNYRVTMAENIIPATNISEQISTAGLEASGTGNMKFMLNGALTIGTLDGANVEIQEEVGPDNCYIFGHTEDQIAQLKGHYNPWDFINGDDEIRNAVNLIRSDFFNISEPGAFGPLLHDIFDCGDRFFIFADLRMYADRHQEILDLYRDNFSDFNRKAILNVACSGKFSSDRTIREYAEQIWNAKPCPVKLNTAANSALIDARKIKK